MCAMKKLSNNGRVNPCHSAQVPLDLKFSEADMTKAICYVLESADKKGVLHTLTEDDMCDKVLVKLRKQYVRKYRLNHPASPLS